ncbi:hypothetical protein F4680DRAFT_429929 [Xylaria scruposa]|nr:hypothetical protein F4680DRAFT_429929 [Xylaria scruposa]
MKFGERLEEASVPGWSLHNVDYNSLKHQIKAHTSRDQATAAMTIPGQQDHALRRFEDAFYLELCSQHNRVGLFVISKADEISRRLRHLSGLAHQLMLKCADTRGLSTRRQRRFAKYQTQIEECGRDIQALGRFVDAQVTAFRKILKKYKHCIVCLAYATDVCIGFQCPSITSLMQATAQCRSWLTCGTRLQKWTGSTTLGSRFKDNVLGNPKSFTHYNFAPLRLQYRELRTDLDAASPLDGNLAELRPPPPTESRDPACRKARRDSRRSSYSIPATTPAPPPTTYWNEYDHGSEAGDQEDDAYVIYIDPNADDEFPGLAYVKNMLGGKVDQVRHWLQSQKSRNAAATSASVSSPSETQSLLTSGASTDYFTIAGRRPPTSEDGYRSSSDEGGPHQAQTLGFAHTYSYSSTSSAIADPKMSGSYEDRVLTRGVVLAFVAAFVLLGVSGLLVATGRRHLRLEVDAGATLGSVVSLSCACMGLGAMLYRQYPAGYLYCLAVWAAFVTVCALNGILLVLVASNSSF